MACLKIIGSPFNFSSFFSAKEVALRKDAAFSQGLTFGGHVELNLNDQSGPTPYL